MATLRDGHVRVLPVHVANKIAAGEVVERPASVVKELVENSIDAKSGNIKIVIEQGGRKLIQITDDGIGMTKEDAVLSLERQATSKIFDVDDIENIDTLGFRGEAIPSIASVSRFSITTRTHDSDEATYLQVDAGTLVQVSSAGSPPGTTVEVRDLFCNVPARRKFLRAAATEETHIKRIFTVHALAHPAIGFTLVADGHEEKRLAPAKHLKDRVFDLFGGEMNDSMLKLNAERNGVKVSGLIERPNLAFPTRRDQYVFVNGRPATAPSIQYAIKEAYPSRQGDAKPAAIIFIEVSPSQVDVNVHPTKREVRFRDNSAVKLAVMEAIENAIKVRNASSVGADVSTARPTPTPSPSSSPSPLNLSPSPSCSPREENFHSSTTTLNYNSNKPEPLTPAPVAIEFALDGDSTETRPWQWFKYLASMDLGFILLETDAGLVTLNPKAARERIVFEHLLETRNERLSQQLLIPETIKLSPPDFARIKNSLEAICAMGFQVEAFGENTIKVDAIPESVSGANPAALLLTIAEDLAEGGIRRGDRPAMPRWREEVIARSVAMTFAGASLNMTKEGAIKLVEELASCKTPYISPRGKPTMIFTSSRELQRKFNLV